MNALLERPETLIPTAKDAALATESSRILSAAGPERELTVSLDSGQTLTLPKGVGRLLAYLLTEMSQGNAVTVIPIHAELTTQEAADHLNVSRPHLVELLERGEIAHRKVGTHRRVRYQDLLAYKTKREREREAALKEMADQAQDLKMGY